MRDDYVYVSFEKLLENETIQNYFGDVGNMRLGDCYIIILIT